MIGRVTPSLRCSPLLGLAAYGPMTVTEGVLACHC
jgi:hypothetical protein